MTLATIPLSWAVRQASGAVASGISLSRLLERSLITPRFGDDRDCISPLQLNLFYASLVLETEDGTHRMASRRSPPDLGPLALRVLVAGPQLGDGLGAVAKLYRMCAPFRQLSLSTNGKHAFLALRLDDDDQSQAVLQEDIQLCYLFFGLTCFLGRPFPVSWVATRDPHHMNLGEAHWAMKSRVKLHSWTGLVFPKALLSARPHPDSTSDLIWRPLEMWSSFIEGPALRAPPGVNNHQLHVDHCAANIGVAPSTYRRTLAQQGYSFRQIREQELVAAAMELLGGSSNLDAIAAELGYSDSRSFRRFMTRSTGRTPSELRRDLGMAVSPAKLKARLKEVVSRIPL